MLRSLWRAWTRVWRILKWPARFLLVALVLLLIPIANVELFCRGTTSEQDYRPVITDTAFHRREANTYLTYPEWHIVFAYDGFAEALKTRDEHAFDYLASVSAFWDSACKLMKVADDHGGADWGTRSMIHTIGASFTAEMMMKAAYEETVGRFMASVRGPAKTPQDKAVAAMAADYAAFLRQTPWYEYSFRTQAAKLWAAPIEGFARGWERRIGIGLEFAAKSAYSTVLAKAVAATGQAQLTNRSIVAGLTAAKLAAIPGVKVIAARGDDLEIETPRYALFTRILSEIALQGGTIREIAGNDDIMVTLIVPIGAETKVAHGTVIMRMRRDGFWSDRMLVSVKVSELAALFKAYPLGDPGVEHVFDY